MRDVVIVGAARTPIGSFLGSLSSVSATRLGSIAIQAALERAGVAPELVEEVLMGCVLPAGLGQAPARQAALGAGLPRSVPCTTVNKVCGSGLKTVALAAQSIALGDADIVVAGGMESMSNAPHLVTGARAGFKMGSFQAVDSMVHDGLWDVYTNQHMGNCAELCARENKISRKAQDEFAAESYRRAQEAIASGAFRPEIVPVTIKGKDGEVAVDSDEEPGRGNIDKLPKLRPAFDKEGTITAGNASSLNDGGAAVVLMSADAAGKRGAKILGRVVTWAQHAQEPEWFTTAPAQAIAKACKKAGWDPKSVDLWEINEAFSVVSLANNAALGLDAARVNIRGGAVALGHPIGASGARVLVTLLHAMKDRGARTGGASLCIGGGEALALLVERGELTVLDDIKLIGVLGAGQMGRGIAQVAAQAGLDVIMVDATVDIADKGLGRIARGLDRLVQKEKLSARDRDATLARITPKGGIAELARADFVIEAAPEREDLKLEIFSQLTQITRPTAILASNTSSISITKLGSRTNRPEKVIGMHFMNPVPVMKLVEIVRGLPTNDETYHTTVALAEKFGKTTIAARDIPGFIVNRVLIPLLNEACYALYEGLGSVSDIDKGVRLGLNHPMGPLELADLIGLDTCLAIAEVLHTELGDPKYRPCPLLRQHVAAGWHGRKSGRGFYIYDAQGNQVP